MAAPLSPLVIVLERSADIVDLFFTEGAIRRANFAPALKRRPDRTSMPGQGFEPDSDMRSLP